MSLLDDDAGERRPARGGHAAAVVLAAGQGERFGTQTKQLALLEGRPLVAHAITAAVDAGLTQVIVVVGHDADAVAAAAREAHPDVEVVVNPDHRAGQSTSLRTGISAAARAGAEVAVVVLADQPRIASGALAAVVAAVRGGAPSARARYVDGPGHPVAFARTAFDRLVALDGDVGARNLLDALGTVLVPVDATIPLDVDAPGDLDHLRDHPPR